MAREQLIQKARDVFRSYGFSPIDTPALEYSEILLGKGGEESDKQLFRFTDQGNRDVAMRFDLTVPLARFAAQHVQEIGIPFKRYHIATVWRGENPQKGRYREFIQCDFDTIGTESNVSDIETLLVTHDLMQNLGFSRFRICVNNRLVLNGLLEKLGLTEQSAGILRALDKLSKVGPDAVRQEMIERVRTTAEQASSVLKLTELAGETDHIFSELETLLAGSEQGMNGISQLREMFAASRTAGIAANRIKLDVSIARGLNYYTGSVYETYLDELPGIGSVCSGGRYDNLAELFTSKKLPGVGASLGLDRLLTAMEELGMVEKSSTPAQVLVTQFDAGKIGEYFRIVREMQRAGIASEVYPDARPIGKQLRYANRKRFQVAVIAGDQEFSTGTWQVKDLIQGTQTEVSEPRLIDHIHGILKSADKSQV